jgi:hypothetical protein
MSTSTVLDRLLDPLTSDLGAEAALRLASLPIDQGVQDYLDDLAERNTEGELTAAEREEYETLVTAIDILTLLKAKARAAAAHASTGD